LAVEPITPALRAFHFLAVENQRLESVLAIFAGVFV
jgi:hypothetical protein